MTHAPNVTGRTLLQQLGIGQFNTTMVIPYLFVAPAATDPKAPPIMLIVQKLQQNLNAMGAALRTTGYLDLATAHALVRVVGERWMSRPWSDNITAVLNARDAGISLAEAVPPVLPGIEEDLGAFDFLPDVPGGKLTYAAAAAILLYLHFRKRR